MRVWIFVALLAIAGTTSSVYLFHCRHVECDSLKFTCPSPPVGPGEHLR